MNPVRRHIRYHQYLPKLIIAYPLTSYDALVFENTDSLRYCINKYLRFEYVPVRKLRNGDYLYKILDIKLEN
jgi:hypothetical protein